MYGPSRIIAWFAVGLIGGGGLVAPGAAAASTDLPRLHVLSVRRVYDQGPHNAFTDLCQFGGRYYLTFRNCPDGHMVHPTSSILILASEDGQQWKQVHRFHVDKRDTRDPHFLKFRGKLFVYTGTWYCGATTPKKYEMNKQLGYAVWTDDGRQWQGPRMLEGTYGHYVWRAASYQGKAYLCGRRKHQFAETVSRAQRDRLIESAMLESDDGLIWRYRAMFQQHLGDETAFLFEPDGKVLAIGRRGGGGNAQVLRSRPPYQDWQRADLKYEQGDGSLGGPLLATWQGHYLVGGRQTRAGKPVTVLSWLVRDRLHEAAILPSGGDNSYPGFVAQSKNRALVSYYSSHEKDPAGNTRTAIYVTQLQMDE